MENLPDYDQKCYLCLHPYHGLCANCWAKDPRNKPQEKPPKVAKLEDFSDVEIDREFKRRARLQMRPVNERAAKLAKDAWSDRREW